jgi:hypothetical protein
MDDMSFMDSKTLVLIDKAIRKSFNQNSLEMALVLQQGKSNEVGPRGGSRYCCRGCNQLFGRNDIFVDHCSPVVPVNISMASMTLQMYYERCFTTADNLQLLCKLCHKNKTSAEATERAKFRKLRKGLVEPKRKLKVA